MFLQSPRLMAQNIVNNPFEVKYNRNRQTTNGFTEMTYNKEQSLNNRSSVKHNIITHDDHNPMGIIDVRHNQYRSVYNRKKALGKFHDEKRITAVHENKDYHAEFSKNPNLFRQVEGFASNTFYTAKSYGIDKPFSLER